MNTNQDIARVLTFLRKERNLSQKQAAQELGVSQALLSHYEKGIRQCGLDFVVKAAEYYHVSCDYLLGRTVDREYTLTEQQQEHESKKQSAAQSVNRRLLGSMLLAVYDLAANAKNRKFSQAVSNYFMLSAYRVFRCLYSANKNNPEELFTISKSIYSGYADAAMVKIFSDIQSMSQQGSDNFIKALGSAEVSPEKLAEEYPASAGEIFNVIQQAENTIAKIKTIKS